jgi:hypothetical protein
MSDRGDPGVPGPSVDAATSGTLGDPDVPWPLGGVGVPADLVVAADPYVPPSGSAEPADPPEPADGRDDPAGLAEPGDPLGPGDLHAAAMPGPPDQRSFAERYRDTNLGGPVAAAASATPAAPTAATAARPRGRRVLLVVGVVLLAGSVLIGLALAASGRLDATRGPDPSAAFAYPTAPTATTDPATAAAAIDAFVAVAANPKLAYEVRLSDTLTSGDESARTKAVGSVAGRDADLHIAVTRPAGGLAAFGGRVIAKDAATWVQLDGQTRWRKGAPAAGVMPNTHVFDGISAAEDLVYVGREMRRGSLTHHLVTTAAWQPGPAAARLGEYPDFRLDFATMDVWALDDGRPVEAQAVAYFSEDRLGENATWIRTATAETTWVFSNVGAKINVKAPK